MIAGGEAECAIRAAVVAWPAADLPALLDANEVVVCCARTAGGRATEGRATDGRSAVDALVRTILRAALADPPATPRSLRPISATLGGLRENVRPNVRDQHAPPRSHVRPDVPSHVTAEILAETDIVRASGGKPHIAAHTSRAASRPLNFNISHSGDVLLVALSCAAEVGVDVERVRAVPEWRAIAARVLSAAAHAELSADIASGADENETFIRHWCRHEACVKATGEGLFPSDTRDDANDSNTGRAQPRAIDLPELPLPAGAGRYRGALALLQ